jgi:hypothetical protein
MSRFGMGDIQSELYLISADPKNYQDRGRHPEDLPLFQRRRFVPRPTGAARPVQKSARETPGLAATITDIPRRHALPSL